MDNFTISETTGNRVSSKKKGGMVDTDLRASARQQKHTAAIWLWSNSNMETLYNCEPVVPSAYSLSFFLVENS
jgi:hypothetical protein